MTFFKYYIIIFSIFIALLLEAGEWGEVTETTTSPFFILSYTTQIYMHNDGKHYSFLKPATPVGCDWPIKMQ